jgi:hypothetical protein
MLFFFKRPKSKTYKNLQLLPMNPRTIDEYFKNDLNVDKNAKSWHYNASIGKVAFNVYSVITFGSG